MARIIINGDWTLLAGPVTLRVVPPNRKIRNRQVDWREAGEVPLIDALHSVYDGDVNSPLQSSISVYVRSTDGQDLEVDTFLVEV